MWNSRSYGRRIFDSGSGSIDRYIILQCYVISRVCNVLLELKIPSWEVINL